MRQEAGHSLSQLVVTYVSLYRVSYEVEGQEGMVVGHKLPEGLGCCDFVEAEVKH